MRAAVTASRREVAGGARRPQGIVYVIELSAPLGNLTNRRAQCRYYVGWALDPEARLAEHRAGRGAKLLAAAVERGIDFHIIATLPGGRALERAIKNSHNVPRLLRRWAIRGLPA